MAEGLLDHHAAPGVLGRLRQTRAGELAADDGEGARRHGEVERVVPLGAALLVELCDCLAEALEGLVVVEGALDEADALGELVPDVFTEGRAGVLLDGVVDDLREVLVLPVAPGEAREREAWGQQATVGEVVDGRHELLAGEVSGHAEDHETGRSGDARQAQVARIAQRVGVGFDLCGSHGRHHLLRVWPVQVTPTV